MNLMPLFIGLALVACGGYIGYFRGYTSGATDTTRFFYAAKLLDPNSVIQYFKVNKK